MMGYGHEKKPRKIIKTAAIILLIAVLLFPVIFFFVRYSMYQSDRDAEPVTGLSTYQKWSKSGWVCDEPFAVFPEPGVLLQAEKTEYLWKRVRSPLPLLYDDDAVLYLACELNEDAFCSECERLQPLCGDRKSGYGQNPAYVYAVCGGGLYYQYALVEEETCTIHYVGFQNQTFARTYIDASLLPAA